MKLIPAQVIEPAAYSVLPADDNFFRELYRQSPLGMARVSLDGRFLDLNPRLCAMLGCEPGQLLGQSVISITIEDDVKLSQDWLRRLRAREIDRVSLEKCYRNFGGEALWMNVSIGTCYDSDGRPQYFIAMFEDISKRKAIEDALLQREAKYRTVLATTSEGFWLLDAQGQVLDVNDAYCRLSGYSRDELIGMHVSDLDASDDTVTVNRRIDEIKRCGKLTFVSSHRRKDGSQISLLIWTTYVTDNDGQIFSFMHDLTAIHSAEAELQVLKRYEQISRQSADEARGMLLHLSETTQRQVGRELHDDVGQILTGAAMLACTMAASLGKTNQPEAPLASQLAGFLNQAVDKLRAVTHGLYPVDLESAGLWAMLETLVNQVATNTTIKARLHQDCSLLRLEADQALQLYRVVQEASSNVMRHSGAKHMGVTFACQDDVLTLRVTDDGYGIVNNRRMRGAGIGLHIMRARAERIGATLNISTLEAGGTCVELTLKLSQPVRPPPQPSPDPHTP